MIPKKRCPTHPGIILLNHFLKPMEISQSKFAKHLGGSWTPGKVNEIIKGKRGISEQTALDFSDALGTTPQFWLNLQMNYNLWIALQLHTDIEPLRKVI